MSIIQLQAGQLRNLKGRFARAEGEVLEIRRDEMRQLSRRWLTKLRAEAPKGKTGKYRKSFSFRTSVHGNEIASSIMMPDPLTTWIVRGTKAHKIAPRRKKALAFFWKRIGRPVVVPKKGGGNSYVSKNGTLWLGKGYVMHPGTKPNDFIGRAEQAMRSDADATLRRMALRYGQQVRL